MSLLWIFGKNCLYFQEGRKLNKNQTKPIISAILLIKYVHYLFFY